MATVRVMVKVKQPSPFMPLFVQINLPEDQVPPEGTDISFTVVGEVTKVFPAPLPSV